MNFSLETLTEAKRQFEKKLKSTELEIEDRKEELTVLEEQKVQLIKGIENYKDAINLLEK